MTETHRVRASRVSLRDQFEKPLELLEPYPFEKLIRTSTVTSWRRPIQRRRRLLRRGVFGRAKLSVIDEEQVLEERELRSVPLFLLDGYGGLDLCSQPVVAPRQAVKVVTSISSAREEKSKPKTGKLKHSVRRKHHHCSKAKVKPGLKSKQQRSFVNRATAFVKMITRGAIGNIKSSLRSIRVMDESLAL